MRRISTLLFPCALLLLTLVPGPLTAQSMEDLAGGWLVTSWTSAEGEVNESPQRGLFIFTATGQYSMMYVNTAEPRPDVSDAETDEEIRAAFDSFTANSGRYTLEGDQLTYDALVAKWPNYMNSWNMQTRENGITVTVGMEGGLLTLTWEDGRKVTLRRPGGAR